MSGEGVALASSKKETSVTAPPIRKRKQVVLEEDAYAQALSDIIQRDFFPNLPRIRVQADFLEAQERNDTNRMRQITMNYLRDQTTPGTSFSTETLHIENGVGNLDSPRKTPASADVQRLSLDQFQSKYTSEDNASFNDILEKTIAKRREKFDWILSKEGGGKLLLAAPEDKQRLEDSAQYQTWEYTARNALMYTPEGLPQELQSQSYASHRKLSHPSTRFDINHIAPVAARERRTDDQSSESVAAGILPMDESLEAIRKLGELKNNRPLSPSGRPLDEEDEDKIAGYAFVSESPLVVNGDMTPLMTWGAVEGTPLPLSGPAFKMPPTPRREQVGIALTETASRAHRKRVAKESRETFYSPSASRSGGWTPGTPRRDQISALSPAARKLMRKSGGARLNNVESSPMSSFGTSPKNL